MGKIRTYCHNCHQWTDVSSNYYGYKFAPVGLNRGEELDHQRYLDEVDFVCDDSDDDYRCGNCANRVFDGDEELLENLYDNHDQGLYDFDIRTIEEDYPNGLPDWPEFCYDEAERIGVDVSKH